MAHKSLAARALAYGVALPMAASALGAPCVAQAASVPMVDGGVVMPPHGWLNYCSRHDDDPACHAASVDRPRSAPSIWPPEHVFTGFRSAVLWRVIGSPQPCSAWGEWVRSDGDCATPVADFRADMVGFSGPGSMEVSIAPAVDSIVVPTSAASCAMDDHATCSAEELTAAHVRDLKRVLRNLRRLPAVADEARFGKAEFWEAADAAGGDCEDFALAARAQLMAAGWARGALRLATAWTEKGEFHVVLTVDVRRRNDAVTTLVVDRRYRNVVNWRDMVRAGYRFVSRQAAVGATWVDLARPVIPHTPDLAAPSAAAPVVVPSPAPVAPIVTVASLPDSSWMDGHTAAPSMALNHLALVTCPDWLALCRGRQIPVDPGIILPPANLLLTALRQNRAVGSYRSAPWTFQTTTISSAPKVS